MALGRPPEPGRAVVVGTGLIGGSIGLRLRRNGWHVTGRDRDPVRVDKALALGALDAVGDDPSADITFVATPVAAVADEARRALAATSGLVTDVGGVKASIVEAVADPRFVGGHPMAGSEQEGVEGAAPELFEGATWVLTPTEGTDAAAFAQVRQIVGTLGAEVVALPPDRHDELVAVVSHVPHLAAATLMRLADERSEEHRALLRLAAGGFRDMTRIASGHPGIWPDICRENRAAIVGVLDDLSAALHEMRDLVADGDRAGLLDGARRGPGGAGEPAGPVPHRGRPQRGAHPGARPSRRGRRRGDPRRRPRREHRRPRDRPLDRGPAGRDRDADRAPGGRGVPGRAGRARLPPGGAARRRRLTVPADVPTPHRGPAFAVEPIDHPVDATVIVPGSKSLTNRALICAGLAEGASIIDNALVADDSLAMRQALGALGVGLAVDDTAQRIAVTGTGGRLRPGPRELDMRLSGTTSRFLLPVVAAFGEGRYRIDGGAPLRARPMGPVLDGIAALGAAVEPEGAPGHLPVTVDTPGALRGGDVAVAGDTSSQFLSGLLLAAPGTRDGVRLHVTTPLVSRPFVDLTVDVMAAFGVDVAGDGGPGDLPLFTVAPGRYRAADHRVEPDASAASYLLAAAALLGGRVTVAGLGSGTRQGDARFADLLARMGARVQRTADGTTVTGSGGTLRSPGEVDMVDMPDMAQTLAAVAVFADAPTRVTGVELIRGHETDRIAAVVTELRRAGIRADEHRDGFTVHPGTPRPARIETYDDHRMAMSFALLGLRAPGIEIADPACVGKTFPRFWDVLATLRSPSHR